MIFFINPPQFLCTLKAMLQRQYSLVREVVAHVKELAEQEPINESDLEAALNFFVSLVYDLKKLIAVNAAKLVTADEALAIFLDITDQLPHKFSPKVLPILEAAVSAAGEVLGALNKKKMAAFKRTAVFPEEPQWTVEDAFTYGSIIGIDWNAVDFTPEDLLKGMIVELEHGTALGERTNITNNNPLPTAQIALAHLLEHSQYYEFLEQMEKDMEASSK